MTLLKINWRTNACPKTNIDKGWWYGVQGIFWVRCQDSFGKAILTFVLDIATQGKRLREVCLSESFSLAARLDPAMFGLSSARESLSCAWWQASTAWPGNWATLSLTITELVDNLVTINLVSKITSNKLVVLVTKMAWSQLCLAHFNYFLSWYHNTFSDVIWSEVM